VRRTGVIVALGTLLSMLGGGFAAFSRGGLDWLQRPVLRARHPLPLPWRSPLAGTTGGVAQVLEFLGRAFELSGGTLRLEVRDVLANHEHAVTLAMVHVERAGRRLEHHGVFVSHITEGKATELWRKA